MFLNLNCKNNKESLSNQFKLAIDQMSIFPL